MICLSEFKAGHFVDVTQVDLGNLSLGVAGESATDADMEEDEDDSADLEMKGAYAEAGEQTKNAEEGAGAA